MEFLVKLWWNSSYCRCGGLGLMDVLSLGEQDLTAQAELPGLPSYEKWDSKYGRNECRFWIHSETRKTEQQLDGAICTQLSGASQILAKNLLMDSFTMSDSLYTFITTSYEDSMNSSCFDSHQAWTLTCSFVKGIFQKISHERAIVRDGTRCSQRKFSGLVYDCVST